MRNTPPQQRDLLTEHLFAGHSVVSQQLLAYSKHRTNQVHSYPDAFAEVQEYSFGSCCEQYTESLHVQTKTAHRRTHTHCKPASTCARQRKAQGIALIEKHCDWLVSNWNSRTLHCELLAHLKSPAEVSRLRLAEKHAFIYGYHPSQQFSAEAPQTQVHIETVTNALNSVQRRPAVPVTASIALAVQFFKGHFTAGAVFALPKHLFDMVVDASKVAVPAPCKPADLVALILPDDVAAPETPVQQLVFMQVINARPENLSRNTSG